jgi:hypothetical protein
MSCTFRSRVDLFRGAGIIVIALAMIEACVAADSASCNGELAQMQSDRRDIAARANDVATAIEQFETCARQNAASGNVPDSCRRQADDYQKAVGRLNSALDGADHRVRLIGGSCVQPSPSVVAPAVVVAPPTARPAPQPVVVAPPIAPAAAVAAPAVAAPQLPPINDASCDTARSYKGKIPFEGVVKICLRTLTEAQCRQCLGTLE